MFTSHIHKCGFHQAAFKKFPRLQILSNFVFKDSFGILNTRAKKLSSLFFHFQVRSNCFSFTLLNRERESGHGHEQEIMAIDGQLYPQIRKSIDGTYFLESDTSIANVTSFSCLILYQGTSLILRICYFSWKCAKAGHFKLRLV